MSTFLDINPEYIYVTIPAEYICIYHRILAMLADYGEDMLKDCKAACKDRNSNIIECFNMFNAAVAARKLGKLSLANTLINYIKTTIEQIYGGCNNETSFVFPIDENGQIKALVSCGERPQFKINADDGELYEHKLNNGFDEHFQLGPEDESPEGKEETPVVETGLVINFTPSYEEDNNVYHPCGELEVRYDGDVIDKDNCIIDYYFDNTEIRLWSEVGLTQEDVGTHNFKVVVTYNNVTKIDNQNLVFTII